MTDPYVLLKDHEAAAGDHCTRPREASTEGRHIYVLHASRPPPPLPRGAVASSNRRRNRSRPHLIRHWRRGWRHAARKTPVRVRCIDSENHSITREPSVPQLSHRHERGGRRDSRQRLNKDTLPTSPLDVSEAEGVEPPYEPRRQIVDTDCTPARRG